MVKLTPGTLIRNGAGHQKQVTPRPGNACAGNRVIHMMRRDEVGLVVSVIDYRTDPSSGEVLLVVGDRVGWVMARKLNPV
jgi:hypothetical protein